MENLTLKKMSKDEVLGVYTVGSLSLREGWSLDSIKKELENSLARYVVLLKDNEVVAFSGAWLIACEGQITNVAVHPNCRGLGFGKKIMEGLISLLKEEGCLDVTLEVRESNSVARNLYSSLGFKAEGVRKNFYEDGNGNKEDGIIMWLRDI